MVSWFRRRARTAALSAGVTTAALVVAAAVAPGASADPVESPHDFSNGQQGWFSYGGGSSSSVVDGELCVVVPAGTTNPWDVAAQHDDVAFEAGGTYTVSFSAHATAPVSVNLRAGIGWPDDVSSTVALTPDKQDYAFSWTPEFSGDGNLSFQLGAQAEDYTFCLDDFQLSGDVELLPDTSFDGVLPEGWSANGWNVTSEPGEGAALCFEVLDSSGQYAGLVLNGLPIEAGANYRLAYTASASNGATIRTIVGENAEPWRTAFVDSTELGTDLTEHVLAFTSPLTFPAESSDPSVGVGQVALQMGARGDFTFCITSISLKKVATPPPPYEPDVRGPIRVNQLGYLPDGPKNATVVSEATEPLAWELQDAQQHVVASGEATPAGVDPSSQLAVQTVDFGSFSTPGTGYTLVVGQDRSDPFAISATLYDQLRYDALNYFYPVRSGIAVDVPDDRYDRPAGHVSGPDGEVNKGDLDVACLTAAEDGGSWSYGTWTCPEGYSLDVVGGWYDAGDHGKYVVNGGISVAQVMSTYERTLTAPGATAGALDDGTLDLPEHGNGVPDVLDEARWELEWMLKMVVPSGEYAGMVHHKVHDEGWTGLPLLPADDPQVRSLHRPSTAATLNLAAVAAQGARLFAEYDEEFAATLLATARSTYEAALAHPDVYAPAAAGNDGGGPYDDQDVTDEFYWAAAELYVTTGEQQYADAVLASPHHTGTVFDAGGFSWGATAALGRLTLATVPNALPDRDRVRASVVEAADAYLAGQAGQPWGSVYVPQDDVYVWGSNSSVANALVVVATAFDLTGEREYLDGVLEGLDYLFGRNALNRSYVTGWGTVTSQNQHSRWFAAQLDPSLPHPPVGSLAGGPNSMSGTWDPTMQAAFTEGCAPAMCYLDEISSWASNEITVNWNSALSWVASFVADQPDGSVGEVAPTVTTQPTDATVALGATATFTAAATGRPEPTVRWQVKEKKGWKDVKGARSTTLEVHVTKKTVGQEYRAVFTNAAGEVATTSAKVVLATAAPVVTAQPQATSARVGTWATFRAAASGSPEPSVTWQVRHGKGPWRTVPGARGTTLKVVATPLVHRAEFRAVFSNPHGTATTDAATLTVTTRR